MRTLKYRKDEKKPVRIAPTSESTKGTHLQGMRVKVTKAYVTEMKLTKDPKNLKKRTVLLAPDVERLYMRTKEEHLMNGGNMKDKIFT